MSNDQPRAVDGFCYLQLFVPSQRFRVKSALGGFPLVSDLRRLIGGTRGLIHRDKVYVTTIGSHVQYYHITKRPVDGSQPMSPEVFINTAKLDLAVGGEDDSDDVFRFEGIEYAFSPRGWKCCILFMMFLATIMVFDYLYGRYMLRIVSKVVPATSNLDVPVCMIGNLLYMYDGKCDFFIPKNVPLDYSILVMVESLSRA